MSKNRFKSLCFIVLFYLIFQPITHAYEIVRVTVLPFKINSAEDLGYIQKGIQDMLASRISVEGKVVVLGNAHVRKVLPQIYKEPITDHVAKMIGKQLDVDYIISGSLTKIGNNMSIDAKIFDIKDKNSTISLSLTGKGIDDVIPKINDFAVRANARIMGKTYPKGSSPPPSASSKASDFMSDFLNSEKLDKGEKER